MNSGLHDTWNLTGKLRDILLDGRDAEPALAPYDRQRRSIARSFVQTQTIENKKFLESANGDGRSVQEHRMVAIAADPCLRREYLLRQSMYDSLQQVAAIV